MRIQGGVGWGSQCSAGRACLRRKGWEMSHLIRSRDTKLDDEPHPAWPLWSAPRRSFPGRDTSRKSVGFG